MNVCLDEEYVDHKKVAILTGRPNRERHGRRDFRGSSTSYFRPLLHNEAFRQRRWPWTSDGLHGIVKQNHGFVWAYSEVGMGAVFKIYLPCVRDRMATIEVADADAEAVSGGTETVLLVEDEDALRQASAEFLSLRGYTVLQAKDGQDALSIAKNHGNAIDLAVTDVVMPRVSGGQLAKELAEVRPETRVLFGSGYAGQTVIDHKVIDVESNFLQKPFTLKQLAGKVRAVLDHSRNAIRA